MGKRTAHQEDAKALLVVRLAEESLPNSAELPDHGGAAVSGPDGRDALSGLDGGVDAADIDAAGKDVDPDLAEVAADVDVLPLPKIDTGDGEWELNRGLTWGGVTLEITNGPWQSSGADPTSCSGLTVLVLEAHLVLLIPDLVVY